MYIRFVHGLGLCRTEDVKTNVLISPVSEFYTAYAPDFCACTQCAFEGSIKCGLLAQTRYSPPVLYKPLSNM